MKKQKVVTVALVAALSLTALPAFADVQMNSFPSIAVPGTKIICETDGSLKYQPYVSQNNTTPLTTTKMEINELVPLAEEEKLVEEIKLAAKQYPTYYFNEPQIPEIEPGMVASYDGMGYLNKIIDVNGDIVPMTSTCTNVVHSENYTTNSAARASYYNQLGTFVWGPTDDNTLTRTEENVLATGWVTWFDDEIGNHDNILTEDDCATAMNYDRPPSNTAIHVRNLTNNIDAYVYKNDVGSLPNAVLDIRPEKMKNTFKVSVGTNSGRFNGRYFYYR